jgi:hypothetical protein
MIDQQSYLFELRRYSSQTSRVQLELFQKWLSIVLPELSESRGARNKAS